MWCVSGVDDWRFDYYEYRHLQKLTRSGWVVYVVAKEEECGWSFVGVLTCISEEPRAHSSYCCVSELARSEPSGQSSASSPPLKSAVDHRSHEKASSRIPKVKQGRHALPQVMSPDVCGHMGACPHGLTPPRLLWRQPLYSLHGCRWRRRT